MWVGTASRPSHEMSVSCTPNLGGLDYVVKFAALPLSLSAPLRCPRQAQLLGRAPQWDFFLPISRAIQRSSRIEKGASLCHQARSCQPPSVHPDFIVSAHPR